MLKNFWYAVEFGAAVTDRPVQVRIFDQDLMLFRDTTGTVRALSDICIHRGGSLAGGKVKGNCVECPYHGWRFDHDGACTKIPANREGLPIPKKARVDAYPAVERYGYVFVFLGDLPEDERPPIPELPVPDDVPHAQAEGNRIITGQFTWNANYERVIENGVDAAHAPFVHSTSFGNPDKPVIEDFELHERFVDGHLRSATYEVHLRGPPRPAPAERDLGGGQPQQAGPASGADGQRDLLPEHDVPPGRHPAGVDHDVVHRRLPGRRAHVDLEVDDVPHLLHPAVGDLPAEPESTDSVPGARLTAAGGRRLVMGRRWCVSGASKLASRVSGCERVGWGAAVRRPLGWCSA